MIRSLCLGVSRSMFQLACVFLVVAGICVYISWRLVASVAWREKPMPVRDSAYRLLVALVDLARTVAADRTPAAAAEKQAEPVE